MTGGPANPDHVPGINWDKLYALLDKMTVTIPTYEAGEAVDLNEVVRLLSRVQNRRGQLDQVHRLIQRRLGIVKRRLDVLAQRLKLERSIHADDNTVRGLSKHARDSQVEFMASGTSTVIAALRGKQHEYEHAALAVDGTLRTMETAKQTLNSIKQLALGVQPNSGGSGF